MLLFSGVNEKVWEQCLILFNYSIQYSNSCFYIPYGMDSYEPGTHSQSGNVSFGEILPLVQVNHQILENHDCQEHPTMDQNAVLRYCLSLGHVPSKRFYFWHYQIFRGLIKLKQQKVKIKKIILLEKIT